MGLGVLAAVLVALALGTFFISPRRSLARSVSIAAPPARVYPLLVDLKHGWSKWSPMAEPREGLSFVFSGPESGPGASERWTSKRGAGSLTLTRVEAARLVAYEVDTGAMGMKGAGVLELAPAEAGTTRVTWTDELTVGGNPLVRWLALGMDGMRAKNLERGLEALKRAAAE